MATFGTAAFALSGGEATAVPDRSEPTTHPSVTCTKMTASHEADTRWREVFAELVQQAKADAEFRMRVEATGAVIANFDAMLECRRRDHILATGTIACREYWWGFQLEIPHAVLVEWCDTATEVAHIATLIDAGIGPAAAFKRGLAVWITHRLPELRQLDIGAGVYASMTWIAPNIFVATVIRPA